MDKTWHNLNLGLGSGATWPSLNVMWLMSKPSLGAKWFKFKHNVCDT